MNNETFRLLSKFTVVARKVAGSINPSRIIKDKHYANEVFWKINQIGDEDLIMMSLELQHQLGILTPTEEPSMVATPQADEVTQKYVFGPRS